MMHRPKMIIFDYGQTLVAIMPYLMLMARPTRVFLRFGIRGPAQVKYIYSQRKLP